jgi:TonB family protein
LLGGLISALEGKGEDPVQPRLINSITAIMPISLHNTNLQEPKVVARIQVGENGMVEDLVVLEASHIELIDRAERLIRRARFDVGELRGNEALRFELILPFLYPAELGMFNKTASENVETSIHAIRNRDESVRFYKPGELDEPLKVLDAGEIYVPRNEAGESLEGEAKVKFYVNHRGQVRLPRIESSTSEEMALAAMATVRDMQFPPPTVEGKPAVTALRMPYEARP